jgi:hypothetical protein
VKRAFGDIQRRPPAGAALRSLPQGRELARSTVLALDAAPPRRFGSPQRWRARSVAASKPHCAVLTVLMGTHPSRPTTERHQIQPLSVSSWITSSSSPTSVGNSVVS